MSTTSHCKEYVHNNINTRIEFIIMPDQFCPVRAIVRCIVCDVIYKEHPDGVAMTVSHKLVKKHIIKCIHVLFITRQGADMVMVSCPNNISPNLFVPSPTHYRFKGYRDAILFVMHLHVDTVNYLNLSQYLYTPICRGGYW